MKKIFISILFFSFFNSQEGLCIYSREDEIIKVLKPLILQKANSALQLKPVTVTASHSARSAGGLHDFYSEGDYWWPDSTNLNGPYIQRDGMTNPDNFTDHRKAMIRFSQIIGSLASAYKITHQDKYVQHAQTHLNAWFVNASTLMNPNLLYAQAIKGKVTGRGVGIIDMIQMMEVAKGVLVMQESKSFDKSSLSAIKKWFKDYLKWVTTHPYGIDERDAKNNHGTCWVMQVAVFAKLVNDQPLLDYCTDRYKKVLLPNQMDLSGGYPLELKRTKPYGYSLFNLDAMATICQTVSTSTNQLWNFTLTDNRSIRMGIDFMFPFVQNKNTWTYPQDVMYWKEWPVAHPFLVFGYIHYGNKDWLNTWKQLDHDPQTEEVIRNLPVRNPIIWIE
ncbi:MAG: alginate lyase family protein [Sphingobacteriia bacterium]|jgi:hypothetical protein